MGKMASKQFKVDWYGDTLIKGIENATEPSLWAAGQLLKREAQNRAPSRTGRMKESAYVSTSERSDYKKGKRDRKRILPVSDGQVAVGFGVFYSNYLEDTGAKAHKIPRKSRKILRIEGKFYRSVNHKGMKANPFLAPALEQNKEQIAREVARVIKEKID